jgi:phospholipid-binding lipoprotein MlaA
LPTDKIIEQSALDKYTYVRDAYLQHRRYEVYDGNPPRELEMTNGKAQVQKQSSPTNPGK